VKFGAFLDAIGDEFDLVATGHYAHSEQRLGRPRLLRAVDPVKDQTYFLARLTPQQLARARFPLGRLTKPAVRALAHELGLATQDRKDSQGICFLGKIPYPEFVRHHLGEAPGDIVDVDGGRVLGHHHGLWFHTVGQRKGLGLGGGPWFVVDKHVDSRTLFVAHAHSLQRHSRSDFQVGELRWFADAPNPDEALEVKLRHGPSTIPCALHPAAEAHLDVHLQSPDSGIAAGQFAVFYRGDECLGGGVIR
jgi:tRNA-specific 2-thiouridylase